MLQELQPIKMNANIFNILDWQMEAILHEQTIDTLLVCLQS